MKIPKVVESCNPRSLWRKSPVVLDNGDVMQKVQALGLAKNLDKGLQLTRFHVPVAKTTDGLQLRFRRYQPAAHFFCRAGSYPFNDDDRKLFDQAKNFNAYSLKYFSAMSKNREFQNFNAYSLKYFSAM